MEWFGLCFQGLIQGTIEYDPDASGETLKEEQANSGVVLKDVNRMVSFSIPQQEIRLYGGAQIHRLIDEYEHYIRNSIYPPLSTNEILSAFGPKKNRQIESVVSDIVAVKSKVIFLPFLDEISARAYHIFELMLQLVEQQANECSRQNLDFAKQFYFTFIESQIEKFKSTMIMQVQSLTTVIDWKFVQDFKDQFSLGRHLDTSQFLNEIDHMEQIRLMTQQIFKGIRLLFVRILRLNVYRLLLEPFFHTFKSQLIQKWLTNK